MVKDPKNNGDELTLQHLMDHFDNKFEGVEVKIDNLGYRMDMLEGQMKQLRIQVSVMDANILEIGKDIYLQKHVINPYNRQRLDRLEKHSDLSPIQEPVPPA